jgi:DNA-binding transcriptional regulator YhcF (GntR family)
MDFQTGRSIHEQIRDFIVTGIMQSRWREDERLPSVRELAVELGVNPNTVQRSYSSLQEEGVIQNQRGIGYFVAPQGDLRAQDLRRRQFEQDLLPRVFATMQELQYTPADIDRMWHQWKETNP